MQKIAILLCAVAILLGAAGGTFADCGVDHSSGTTTSTPTERPPVQM
jgi:hypothetical protein